MVARAMTMARIKATDTMITTTSTMTIKAQMAISSSSSPNLTCPILMRLLGDATLWIFLCSPAHQSHREALAGCLGLALRNPNLICASRSRQYLRWHLTCLRCLQQEVKVVTVPGPTAQALLRVALVSPAIPCPYAQATNRHRQMPTQTPCHLIHYL